MTIPNDPVKQKLLLVEADFFQIEDMVQELKKDVPFINVKSMKFYSQDDSTTYVNTVHVEIVGNNEAFEAFSEDFKKENLLDCPEDSVYKKECDGDIQSYKCHGKSRFWWTISHAARLRVENALLHIGNHLGKQEGWRLVSSKTYPNAGGVRSMDGDGNLQVVYIQEDKWQKN